MIENLIWIGIHEYEIQDTGDLFVASITMFGSNLNGNYSFDGKHNFRFNYNVDYIPWNEYVNQVAKHLIKQYNNCSFLLYEAAEADSFCEEIQKRIVYKNECHVLNMLNNKFSMRRWVRDSVPSLPYSIICGEQINLKCLKSLFPEHDSFVIQSEYSSGGIGTWLYNRQTAATVNARISPDRKYCVSPYIEKNISANITAVIYRDDIVLLNPSVQLMKMNNSNFEYCGADFIAYNFLPEILKEKLLSYTRIICKKMQHIGYRGVCGIDYIFTKDQVYFMETNPRFQSSTFLLNKAFHDKGLNISVQQLHTNAFLQEGNAFTIPDTHKCEYSYFKLIYDKALEKQIFSLMEMCKNNSRSVTCSDDFLNKNYELESETFIAGLIFKNNISAVSPNFTCRIHPNLDIYNNPVTTTENKEWIYKKIMLLNHGVNLSPDVEKVLNNSMNYKEFGALDLILDDKYYMNIPYIYGLSFLSPFTINLIDGKMVLTCYSEYVASVKIRKEDALGNKKTRNGIYLRDISYLSNDRLRIYYRDGCYFKDKNIGCKFCDIDSAKSEINKSDIVDILNAYNDHPAVNHYLIGGGATPPHDDFEAVIEVARQIRQYNDKPIYLMSLPPKNTFILSRLKKAGITEVAFNIEIYDREIAKSIMPGKGQIPLETYFAAFKEATKLFGKTGNVRTIFIVGLEPKESLLQGVEAVCSLGVSPILSRFKAIEETELEYMLPPNDEELYEIYREVNKICKKYNVPLGPTCKYCEDNTIKLTT